MEPEWSVEYEMRGPIQSSPICGNNGITANVEMFGLFLLSYFRKRRPVLLFLQLAAHFCFSKIRISSCTVLAILVHFYLMLKWLEDLAPARSEHKATLA